MIFLINSQISFTLLVDVADIPVVMMSISISPVFGSVALYYIAVFISLTASSMCHLSTLLESCILAIDSEILIKDSSWRAVAVIVFLLLPIFRIF